MSRYISCRELIDFLDRYLDGSLPPPQARRFDEHLEVCPACVEYLHTYRETIRLAADAYCDDERALDEAPRELVEAILEVRRPAPLRGDA